MTPYWKLFLGALDDFMLKFLLVCAVIQIVIECSFADAAHLKTGKYLQANENYIQKCQLDLNSIEQINEKSLLNMNEINMHTKKLLLTYLFLKYYFLRRNNDE